jgi:hypothetical protein
MVFTGRNATVNSHDRASASVLWVALHINTRVVLASIVVLGQQPASVHKGGAEPRLAPVVNGHMLITFRFLNGAATQPSLCEFAVAHCLRIRNILVHKGCVGFNFDCAEVPEQEHG